MYRKAGSLSVLSGVSSGPYSGGMKTLDGRLLDASTRERLDRAISGRGGPEPIAYERRGTFTSFQTTWGVIVAMTLLAVLFALGFGNLDSDWATQPLYSAAIYLALGALFALCLVPLLRRRALYGGGSKVGALRPGRYLFPLDAVDIALPDGLGRQTVTVRPLGDARDATIDEKSRDLVLRFEGGEHIRFPLRGDPHGDVALRRLEHAQRLIEELTYSKELEQAFANDLFFDVRVDASWAKLAESATSPVRAPTLAMLILGRLAPVVGALIALGLGGGTFLARRAAGDVALYNHAVAANDPEALDRYLARGGRRRTEARELRQRILDDRAERARLERENAAMEAARERASLKPFVPVAPDPPATDESCIQELTAIASKTHPQSVPILVRNIRADSRVVFVDWIAQKDSVGTLDGETVTRAFARVVSDWCPTSLLRFTTKPPAVFGASVRISYRVTTNGAWSVEGVTVPKHVYAFDVQLFDRNAASSSAGFTLTLGPPAEVTAAPRYRSLFPPLDLSEHQPIGVVYATVENARALDRLYDELWSLFFKGDPHVPLPSPPPVLTP